uniref:Uncharacterized protein n=1 Tax=Rhizophora mucronata TaxID=61149 RepID=A0A2P2QV00_RHIMU
MIITKLRNIGPLMLIGWVLPYLGVLKILPYVEVLSWKINVVIILNAKPPIS